MVKETLKRIFDFLEEKENKIHKDKDKFIWKLKFNETLTKEELNVKGDLDLEFAKITSLPEGLKVGGALDLRFTKVTSLPKGLEVDTFLVVSNTKLTKYSDEELREMVKPGFIKGRIIR